MKEFYEKRFFEQSLALGLRTDHRVKVNTPGLIECMGVKPILIRNPDRTTSNVLAPHEPLDNPFPNETISWPFPQLIRGKGVTLLADKTTIYEVNENGWSKTPLVVYDAYDTDTTVSIPEGGQWHFIDHFDSWMLLNGECTIIKPYKEAITGGAEKILLQRDVRAETGCSFRGRSILGGFTPEHFWNSDWEEVWDIWAASWPGGVQKIGHGLDKNFVLWSGIGGNLLWLIYPDLARQGFIPYTVGGTDTGYDASDPDFTNRLMLDMFRRNELGWIPMESQGGVLKVKPLGKSVVVYSEDTISRIYPINDPVAGFGLENLSSVGITDRGSVGGDDSEHVFVDTNGSLWKLGGDYIPQRLGYREFFFPMLNREIAITFEPEEREFYISDDEECFVLTSQGLGQVPEIITSGAFVQGDLRVVSGRQRRIGKIVTNTFDYGLRAIKKVETIEVGASEYDKMLAAVQFSYVGDTIFRESQPIRVGPEGIAFPQVSGVDLRLVLKGFEEGTRIDSLSSRWKLSDKRAIRGIYANTSNP